MEGFLGDVEEPESRVQQKKAHALIWFPKTLCIEALLS